ncbi:NADP oxidoreductase [Hydrogenovibrio sp. SC-1]|uniref:NADP oxidoreductase n=1 Tax=Hydrogenovibrio sp. SC-1 TaxID=2065820 RepID=UPI000C798ADD|nr:NADP oxidoreductase [Hydrogenovibrio sp. SC-1]PLA74263.1 NADP oxidoreductase [Hydrogenovibrio sp. SC-1]
MQAEVRFNQLLTSNHPDKSIYHLGLKTTQPLNYQPGDWLMVFVENPPSLVDAVLAALHLTGQETLTVKRVGEVTVAEALQSHLEIRLLAPATLNKLKRSFQLSDWPDRQAMMDYADGKDLLDLLSDYPLLTGTAVCDCLTPLAPRYYSIASCKEVVGEHRVDLVYRQVGYQQRGRWRQGLVTTTLSQKNEGDWLEVALSPNRSFKLPDSEASKSSDIIMVAAGTGIAPFIGFCQHWFAASNPVKKGQAWLFFGETHQSKSFLFESQLQQWVQQGLQLRTAFSQDQAEKVYVQDRLWQERAALWPMLMKGAHLYVCGSQKKLWQGVEKTLLAMIVEQQGASFEEAEATLRFWKKAGQVQLDVY